jgi:hypothetical protein
VEAKLGRTDANNYKLTHADASEGDDFVPARKGKGKGKGKATARAEDDEDNDEVNLGGMGEGKELVPGAKMIKMLELLKTCEFLVRHDCQPGVLNWFQGTRRLQRIRLLDIPSVGYSLCSVCTRLLRFYIISQGHR